VMDQSRNYIQIFNDNGEYLNNFGKIRISEPLDIAFDKERHAYVTCNSRFFASGKIYEFSPDGQCINIWKSSRVDLTDPSCIDVDSFGNIYIIDRCSIYI
jgi:hypothetical protein